MAYAFLRKDLTGNLPRKFKIAFDGCGHKDCIQGAINDIGLRAVIRDGKRGFRMIIGGGMGPLPIEAQLLEEFVPEEHLLNKIEAVIRVFNKYGNRKNKNKARMKFVMRERGLDWLREQIEKEYQDILTNGGIAWPEIVPEGFGGYQSKPQPLGDGALLPVVNVPQSGDAGIRRLARNQRRRAAADRLRRRHRPRRPGQPHQRTVPRPWPASQPLPATALVRVAIEQNLVLAFIPLARLPPGLCGARRSRPRANPEPARSKT